MDELSNVGSSLSPGCVERETTIMIHVIVALSKDTIALLSFCQCEGPFELSVYSNLNLVCVTPLVLNLTCLVLQTLKIRWTRVMDENLRCAAATFLVEQPLRLST
jgi:hypothetical protein